MNIKSNKIVLAVIAVLSFVFAYLYDKWKYNTMWERCQASDMIRCGQFTNGPKYCVCATCTEVWMQAKCFHNSIG